MQLHCICILKKILTGASFFAHVFQYMSDYNNLRIILH